MSFDDMALLEEYLEGENFPKAIELAKVLKTKGIAHPTVEAALAREYVLNLRHHDALLAANRALDLDPTNHFALALRAVSLVELGHLSEASTSAQIGGLSASEKSFVLARIAFDQSDFKVAAAEAQKYLEFRPASLTGQALLFAARWIGSGDLEAKQNLEHLFFDCGSIQAGYRLSVCYHLAGDFKRAQETLLACIALAPFDPWPRLRLLGAYILNGEFNAALDSYSQMPVELRELPASKRMHAEILAKMGRLKEAEQLCWHLFRGAEEDIRLCSLLAWVLRKRFRWHLIPYVTYRVFRKSLSSVASYSPKKAIPRTS